MELAVALSERWSEASVSKLHPICMGKVRESWPSLKQKKKGLGNL